MSICSIEEIIGKSKAKFHTEIKRDNNFLSGGEKQRIDLARALVGEPKVILIDDSFTAIDVKNQSKIFNYLQSIKRDKIIIIASNNKKVIEMCDVSYEITENSLHRVEQCKLRGEVI